MHNILLEIIKKKQEDVLAQKKNNTMFREKILSAKDIAIIAEIKFSSPTSPSLGKPTELLQRAKEYEMSGAIAISIITEKYFFKGDPAFVTKIKKTVRLPILQKDFVIDESQIYEAKILGVDALLLIARLVTKEKLRKFVTLCLELGIEPVVEINNEEDLEKACITATKIIAVNARNLETFAINVSEACRLLTKIPKKFITLGFSGIHSSDEVLQYKKAGVKGVLVGTSLMQTKNIKKFIKELQQ